MCWKALKYWHFSANEIDRSENLSWSRRCVGGGGGGCSGGGAGAVMGGDHMSDWYMTLEFGVGGYENSTCVGETTLSLLVCTAKPEPWSITKLSGLDKTISMVCKGAVSPSWFHLQSKEIEPGLPIPAISMALSSEAAAQACSIMLDMSTGLRATSSTVADMAHSAGLIMLSLWLPGGCCWSSQASCLDLFSEIFCNRCFFSFSSVNREVPVRHSIQLPCNCW